MVLLFFGNTTMFAEICVAEKGKVFDLLGLSSGKMS